MSRHVIGVDPADPHGRHHVVVNTEGACLLGATTATLLEGVLAGDVIALDLEGRINQQQVQHSQLYLMDAPGAASLVAEVVGVYGRSGQCDAFTAALAAAMEAQP